MPISPTAYATPLQLELRPSRPLAWTLLFAHLYALASLAQLDLHWLALLLIAVSITLSLQDSLRRHAWLNHPAALTHLVWGRHAWLLEARDGSTVEAELQPTTTRLGPLVVLNFRGRRGFQSSVVLPHRLDRQSYRKLRVRLKLASRGMHSRHGSRG